MPQQNARTHEVDEAQIFLGVERMTKRR